MLSSRGLKFHWKNFLKEINILNRVETFYILKNLRNEKNSISLLMNLKAIKLQIKYLISYLNTELNKLEDHSRTLRLNPWLLKMPQSRVSNAVMPNPKALSRKLT